MGLKILDDRHIEDGHRDARDEVRSYLESNDEDATVAGVLILDAVTVHDGETDRINRTLK